MIKINLDRIKEPRYRKYLALIKWRKIVMDDGDDFEFRSNDFYYEFITLSGRCSYCQHYINCTSCELEYDSLGCETLGHPFEDWCCDKTRKNAQAVLDLIKSVKVPEKGGRV
jgi:hypothetical protein